MLAVSLARARVLSAGEPSAVDPSRFAPSRIVNYDNGSQCFWAVTRATNCETGTPLDATTEPEREVAPLEAVCVSLEWGLIRGCEGESLRPADVSTLLVEFEEALEDLACAVACRSGFCSLLTVEPATAHNPFGDKQTPVSKAIRHSVLLRL